MALYEDRSTTDCHARGRGERRSAHNDTTDRVSRVHPLDQPIVHIKMNTKIELFLTGGRKIRTCR